jgi:hypothetical protein
MIIEVPVMAVRMTLCRRCNAFHRCHLRSYRSYPLVTLVEVGYLGTEKDARGVRWDAAVELPF